MKLEHYSTYTIEDFVLDDDFRAFVLCSSDEKVMRKFEFLSKEK